MNDNELRLGIALCGAELAGTLHVGVLFALERLGIRPTHIAGTSAGALVASMYAHGYRFDDFRRAVKKFPGLLLLDYGFPMVSSMSNLVRHAWKGKDVSAPNGVFRGKRLQRYVKRIHHNRLPKLPYYVVATDLYTTNTVTFTNDSHCIQKGYAEQSTDLIKEICGSCSIPGLFTPINTGNGCLSMAAYVRRCRYPFSVKSVATKSSRLTYKTYLKIGIQSPWWMY